VRARSTFECRVFASAVAWHLSATYVGMDAMPPLPSCRFAALFVIQSLIFMLGLLLISKGFTITTMRVDKKCRPAQRYKPRHHAALRPTPPRSATTHATTQRYDPRHHAALRPTPRGMHARSDPMCGWQHGAHGRHRVWQQTAARPEPCAAPRRSTASVACLLGGRTHEDGVRRGTRYVLCVMYGLLIALYAGSFIWDAARDKASPPRAHTRARTHARTHTRAHARTRARARLRFSWQ
jgi:hypothetical protein